VLAPLLTRKNFNWLKNLVKDKHSTFIYLSLNVNVVYIKPRNPYEKETIIAVYLHVLTCSDHLL